MKVENEVENEEELVEVEDQKSDYVSEEQYASVA